MVEKINVLDKMLEIEKCIKKEHAAGWRSNLGGEARNRGFPHYMLDTIIILFE